MTAAEKLDWAIKTCRKAGLRRTHSLTLVLKRLAEQDLPIPVADLVADPDLKDSHDKATVYRILGRLDELGLVRRVGLHELLVADDETKRHIQARSRVADLLAACMNEGLRTLMMDGVEKALQGLTDLKQVRLVCLK